MELATVANAFSIIAVLIASFAFYKTEVNRTKDVPFEVIPASYEKYYEMNRIALEKPHLTHMFVTPDRYPGAVKLVETSVGQLSDERRAQYLLEERAVADFIFSYYEQSLFQWEATKDDEREFINGILQYFRGRLLRNPRLVYWWMAENGALETSYEDPTRADWRANVQSTETKCDVSGPFKGPAAAG